MLLSGDCQFHMMQIRKWIQHRRMTICALLGICIIMLCMHKLVTWESVYTTKDFSDIDINTDEYELPPRIQSLQETFPNIKSIRIPKIIHQTWKNDMIPPKFIPWIESWKKHHPDWEIWLWTDESARALIQDKYSHLLPMFDGYIEGIRKADALRYIVLYEYGGVYADLDMESLLSLDPLIKKYSCFLAQEPYEHPMLDSNFEHLAMNSLIGCDKRHPFMKLVLKHLPLFSHMWHVLDSTGPHFLTYILKLYKETLQPFKNDNYADNYVLLAPPEYFVPTFDPSKFPYFRSWCSRYKTLRPLAIKACASLKKFGFRTTPLSFSFTVHHWIHSYFESNFSWENQVKYQDIVPGAKIYSTSFKGPVAVQ